MNRYAIGDIHGGATTFRALLGKLGLRRGDRLYLLGDLIDRGPDSRGVLDTILNLREAGFTVRPIRGNHEDMLLRNISGDHDAWSPHWMEQLGAHMLQSFGIREVGELPERYVNLLLSLPLMELEDDYLLVHAGLAFNTTDPIHDSQPHNLLWQESGIPDRNRLGGRITVTGHKFRPMRDIEASLLTDRIFVDNGAFTGMLPELGNLVALDLDRKKLVVQPWLDAE
ncbi:MAG: metallophosphoesterase [Geobacteraceae bacterium]|nr:metallophosphoesterase [Geobacteraceae bacterium]